jgi:hypothetical protein
VPILRARVDGDKLRVDAELALCVRGERESTVTLLEEVEVLGQEQMPRLDVEICYPAPADTLWELGKRYAVSPDRIAAANGLAGCDVSLASSLQGVRCLLIPPITLQK